jgi:hypothetical protein
MIDVVIDQSIPREEHAEAMEVVSRLLLEYVAKSGLRRPERVTVTKDDGEWCLEVEMGQPNIARTRRITGYCSTIANFNVAKLAELHDRRAHL